MLIIYRIFIVITINQICCISLYDRICHNMYNMFNLCICVDICDQVCENRPSPYINWNPLFACTWKIHPCTIQKHQAPDDRLPGLLLQTAFYRCCETPRVHFMVLRGINRTVWGTRLLLMPVLASFVDSIRDITGTEKTFWKISSIQVACRISYKLIAIKLHYSYKMTVLCHKRSTVHSIFQISISRNTICAEMVDFRKPGHIYIHSYMHLYCIHVFTYIQKTKWRLWLQLAWCYCSQTTFTG